MRQHLYAYSSVIVFACFVASHAETKQRSFASYLHTMWNSPSRGCRTQRGRSQDFLRVGAQWYVDTRIQKK